VDWGSDVPVLGRERSRERRGAEKGPAAMADAGGEGAAAARPAARIENLYASVYAFNLFTITDGAVRVVVLLNFAVLGFSPIEIACMFALYELAGVVTNLFGGVLAVRQGLKVTLLLSVALQLVCLSLFVASTAVLGDYSAPGVVLTAQWRLQVTGYITGSYALSGVAKDLMKIACKSVPKLVSKPGEDDSLFRLVAWVTGMKNSFKGVGHVLGAVLVQVCGWQITMAIMIGVVLSILPGAMWWMEWSLGRGSRKAAAVFSWSILRKGRQVNQLSLARFFLFGGRDVWFEVAAPLFLRLVLGWSDVAIGAFMGGYIIIYGVLQGLTSTMLGAEKSSEKSKQGGATSGAELGGDHATNAGAGDGAGDGSRPRNRCSRLVRGPPTAQHLIDWALMNGLQLAIWGGILYPLYLAYLDSGTSMSYRWALGSVLVLGLLVFAFLFAVNSTVHSFFIILYSHDDHAAMDMGFYYMANAGGRLVGTLLSGVLYEYTGQQFGISVCLWVATFFMVAAALPAMNLGPPEPEGDPQEATGHEGGKREAAVATA
jgi:predicted MFS family arabinose efflux permease